jgi:hypothetical protein
MEDFQRQVVIPNPLWAFMEHCMVYCTASCCGIEAFEVHPALLLRKVIDENLAGGDGRHSFRLAWRQLEDLIRLIDTTQLQTRHDQVPFWNEEPTALPQYWLPKGQIRRWLSKWRDSFEKASHYGGLDKD